MTLEGWLGTHETLFARGSSSSSQSGCPRPLHGNQPLVESLWGLHQYLKRKAENNHNTESAGKGESETRGPQNAEEQVFPPEPNTKPRKANTSCELRCAAQIEQTPHLADHALPADCWDGTQVSRRSTSWMKGLRRIGRTKSITIRRVRNTFKNRSISGYESA